MFSAETVTKNPPILYVVHLTLEEAESEFAYGYRVCVELVTES